jgi:pyruvate dehydrogenase E1 component alpha subunit
MFGATFDGNNVLDAYAATRLAAVRCRRGEGPVLLVGNTFRMGGHATHDEADARATFPDAVFKAWGTRDPVGLYEEYLKEEGRTSRDLEDVEAEATAQLDRATREALQSRTRVPLGESALDGVYAPGL